jgi:hypothetical protein
VDGLASFKADGPYGIASENWPLEYHELVCHVACILGGQDSAWVDWRSSVGGKRDSTMWMGCHLLKHMGWVGEVQGTGPSSIVACSVILRVYWT